MAKKTIPDGLIVKGFRSLLNRFSPEAEKYARYKIQKKRGTYDDKQPSFPEPVYRGYTAEEKANMNKGFNKPEKSTAAKSSTPKRKKQSVASSITDAKIKKLDTSVKGENIKAKKERSLSESDKQKLAKLQKMKDRADKKQSRKDKSIERLAFRMGDKATFQDAAALKQKRSQARKQYLRNFASQLARGEQAAPRIAFGEGEGKPTGSTSLAGIKSENKAKNEQAKQDEQSIQSSINTFNTPNSGLGLGLTPMGGVGQNFGEETIRNLRIDMDSTPYDFMREEYNKKRRN